MKRILFVVVIVATSAALIFFSKEKTVKSQSVLVAVIDTGVLLSDSNVFPHLARNDDDMPDNRVDDDKNGKVDDDYGWNFFHDDRDVNDRANHGTQVAISLVESAGKSAKIIPIKVTEHGAGIRAKDLVAALKYAKSRGAKIIQLSLGIAETSPELENLSKELAGSGIILMSAAGAGLSNPFRGESLDKVYPQAYSDSWIVIGTVEDGKALPNSNFGKQILASVEQKDEKQKGSSFLSAKVAGALALKISQSDSQKVTHKEVRAWLKKGSEKQNGVLDWNNLSQTPLVE